MSYQNNSPKFSIHQTMEILTSQSGLALVGSLLSRIGLHQHMNRLPMPSNRGHNLLNSDIAVSMIGLLCQGKTDFADIEAHREDTFFPLVLNLKKVPSQETLRQRLDEATAQWDEALLDHSTRLLRDHAILTSCYQDYIALDVDVSVMDNSGTNKEGVSRTYHNNVDGYAPIFAHIGREGYLLNSDLREGKTHSQAGTAQFLEKTLDELLKLPHKRYLLRMDSGFDSADNLRVCDQFNRQHFGLKRVDVLIKRNLRKESLDKWLTIAKEYGQKLSPRKGKDIYSGRLQRMVDEVAEPLNIVFRVTERRIDRKGQALLLPEIEVETYWCSLDVEADEVIDLYQDRGASEQFHSELKSDIGLERLPSGYFATNKRVMYLALLAFNLLRIIGQESLNANGQPDAKQHRVQRRRLRTVIQDLIYLAARLIRHARGWCLGFGKECRMYDTFSALYFKWAG